MNPTRASRLRPRWLLSRRAAKGVLWTVVLVAAAVGAVDLGVAARAAGAEPAVLAVAPRYRAVVRAYLEAR